MNIAKYLKYFYFIGRNWNFRLAAFTIYHEIRGEKKYHINTTSIDYLKSEKVESNNLRHASIYQGAHYYLLEKAFDYLKENDAIYNITDFGSGKGRVLVVAAAYHFKTITGVDFAPSLCNNAERNIERIKPYYPAAIIEIFCQDAVNYNIDKHSNVFFFFNPFDETIMLQVARKILSSLKENNRKVYVVYLNPLHKDIFLSAGFEEEYYLQKMEYLEMSILSREIISQ